MKASVTRLRVRGVRRIASEVAPEVGDLKVEEFAKTSFGRSVQVARLLPARGLSFAPELLPPLFDAKLIYLKRNRLVLAGIETETVDGHLTDYAQTWLAQLIA